MHIVILSTGPSCSLNMAETTLGVALTSAFLILFYPFEPFFTFVPLSGHVCIHTLSPLLLVEGIIYITFVLLVPFLLLFQVLHASLLLPLCCYALGVCILCFFLVHMNLFICSGWYGF
jgi:hypothetical protein